MSGGAQANWNAGVNGAIRDAASKTDVYLSNDQEERLNSGETVSDVYTGDVDGVTAKLVLQRNSKLGLSGTTRIMGGPAAPVSDTQRGYNPMGDYTGPEVAPAETSQAFSGYGLQMRKVGGFSGDLFIGGVKGLDNLIPETAAWAYRMTGYGAAGLVSLVNTDVSDRMFAQYERVTGRVFEYDNSVQEFGGLAAQLAAPGIVKGLGWGATRLTNAFAGSAATESAVAGAITEASVGSGLGINPRLTQRLEAWRSYEANGGEMSLQRWVQATQRQYGGEVAGYRSGFASWSSQIDSVNGNSLLAAGSHDVYVIREAGSGTLLHFGETGRGYLTRFAEHQRDYAKLGFEIEVDLLRTVEGKSAAKALETRYIQTYTRTFGLRPPFNYSNH